MIFFQQILSCQNQSRPQSVPNSHKLPHGAPSKNWKPIATLPYSKNQKSFRFWFFLIINDDNDINEDKNIIPLGSYANWKIILHMILFWDVVGKWNFQRKCNLVSCVSLPNFIQIDEDLLQVVPLQKILIDARRVFEPKPGAVIADSESIELPLSAHRALGFCNEIF